MFSRSEVIVQTNKQTRKQTPLKTSTTLRYATPMDNEAVATRLKGSTCEYVVS